MSINYREPAFEITGYEQIRGDVFSVLPLYASDADEGHSRTIKTNRAEYAVAIDRQKNVLGLYRVTRTTEREFSSRDKPLLTIVAGTTEPIVAAMIRRALGL